MDLNALRAFLVIAEEQQFTRAAQRLQMAQPNLTRVVLRLEEELGFVLFDRSNKRQFALTPAGQTFFKHVAPLLAAYEEAIQAAQRIAQGETGQLVVGYVPIAMFSGILPAVLQVYKRDFDGELVLRDLSTQSYRTQIKAVREHQVDVVFVPKPFDEAGMAHECVDKASLVVALPVMHRLAHRKGLLLADLAEEAWVSVARQLMPRIYDELLQLCQQRGFEPRFVQTVHQAQAIVSLIAAGAGIAVMSEWAQQAVQQQGTLYRPLLDVSYQSELHVLWSNDGCSPLVQRFLQVVRAISRKQAGANGLHDINE